MPDVADADLQVQPLLFAFFTATGMPQTDSMRFVSERTEAASRLSEEGAGDLFTVLIGNLFFYQTLSQFVSLHE